MNNINRHVVIQFLDWLVGRAHDRDYPAERKRKIIVEETRLIARTRYTVEQGRLPTTEDRDGTARFYVNDEVTAAAPDFDEVYSIFLDVHDEWQWQPEKDEFYPLTASEVEARAYNEDKNGNYPIKLDFTEPAIEAVRDDLDRLFPPDDDDDDGGIGVSPGDDLPPSDSSSGDQHATGSTGNLKRIARNLSD